MAGSHFCLLGFHMVNSTYPWTLLYPKDVAYFSELSKLYAVKTQKPTV
jgi:hypothetical protein